MHIGVATGFSHMRGDAVPYSTFIRDQIENLVWAEELGFDSVWINEHHFTDYSITPDPLMYLSYIAGRTKNLRLATQVLVLPWHNPVRVAEQLLILDHASSGRVIAGFGRGLARREFDGLRSEHAKSNDIFDDTLRLVVKAIETGVIGGKGKVIDQPERELFPKPFRSFEGRMFTTGSTPSSVALTAELGLGRMMLDLPHLRNDPNKPTPPDVYGDTWRKVHGEAKAPPPPFMSGMFLVDESSERAHEIGRKYAAKFFEASVAHYEMDADHFAKVPGYESYEKMKIHSPEEFEKSREAYAGMAVCGTPKEVLERMQSIVSTAKPQGFFPQLMFGPMPQDEITRNMQLFAKACVPEIKSWESRSTIDDEFRKAA